MIEIVCIDLIMIEFSFVFCRVCGYFFRLIVCLNFSTAKFRWSLVSTPYHFATAKSRAC